MAVVDKDKATAQVRLTTGELNNSFDTMESAEAYAADANKRAEDMGIKTRYEAVAKTDAE